MVSKETLEIAECLMKDKPRPLFELIEPEQTGMFLVLISLKNAKIPLSPGELARTLDVSTARVARLLKNMENKNLIERKTRKDDGRKVEVVLLDQGETFFIEHQKRFLNNLEKLIQRVGRHDFEIFLNVCEQACLILKEDGK